MADIAFAIREKVFVQEQKVDQREEYDSHEEESKHYLIYDDAVPVGTARWRTTSNGIKLERFAILPVHRKKGAGITLVKKVLDDVLVFNKPIYLNSQVAAMNLYRRAGFKEEGELFYEANIPHYKMTYQG
ncbi:MAG: GNAT family N-acetyltransferase [Bacteroidota bacterium]